MAEEIEKRIDRLESEVLRLQHQLQTLQSEVKLFLKRYLAACPSCKKEFDLLVNHYSIGLFDNLVYVKCPHCNKSMPVVDKEGGRRGGFRIKTIPIPRVISSEFSPV
ncbi:MAG: hypothetical protein MPW17_18665 [Candidatus Manganitrophus sp.]|nr:hypothetical protein [Candidatus Manganitrophus sp.]WDT70746.1 MAG: hypothetical protein MPW17_18665 [Candidatus Manganitrophus sp.]